MKQKNALVDYLAGGLAYDHCRDTPTLKELI
jgi:hypothetical protein